MTKPPAPIPAYSSTTGGREGTGSSLINGNFFVQYHNSIYVFVIIAIELFDSNRTGIMVFHNISLKGNFCIITGLRGIFGTHSSLNCHFFLSYLEYCHKTINVTCECFFKVR